MRQERWCWVSGAYYHGAWFMRSIQLLNLRPLWQGDEWMRFYDICRRLEKDNEGA